jgi:hypothetical protein
MDMACFTTPEKLQHTRCHLTFGLDHLLYMIWADLRQKVVLQKVIPLGKDDRVGRSRMVRERSAIR